MGLRLIDTAVCIGKCAIQAEQGGGKVRVSKGSMQGLLATGVHAPCTPPAASPTYLAWARVTELRAFWSSRIAWSRATLKAWSALL